MQEAYGDHQASPSAVDVMHALRSSVHGSTATLAPHTTHQRCQHAAVRAPHCMCVAAVAVCLLWRELRAAKAHARLPGCPQLHGPGSNGHQVLAICMKFDEIIT